MCRWVCHGIVSMRVTARLQTAIAFAALSVSAASAQYIAKKVVFSDIGPYAQADLEDLAGIHTVQSFKTDDLNAAAQSLSDSGYFTEVGATLDGPIKGVSVLFAVKPVDPKVLIRASFENFVWFSPDELAAAIHAQAPLFHGYLPVSGPTVDKANAALEQALTAKGIAGAVRHGNFEPSFGHRDRVIQFAVVKRAVVLRSADLAGVSPAMQAAVQKQVQLLSGKRYSEGLAGQPTTEALLAPYFDAGYIDAKLTGLTREVAETPQRTEVVVKATVDEGAVYKVSSLTYAGSDFYSVADFAKASQLHPEDVASQKVLRQALIPIDTAYKNHGYMDAVADVVATRDPATHHVAYVVSVTPGEVYTLGKVTPTNMPDIAKADFDSGFPLKPGDPYSPGAVSKFLVHLVDKPDLKKWNAGFVASADPETHTVDLTVNFAYAYTVR